MLTFEEVKEKLAEQYDPESICDLLGITSQELVEAFEDKIEAHFHKVKEAIE